MVSLIVFMLLFSTKQQHSNCVARETDTSNPCPGVKATAASKWYPSFVIRDVGACCYCNAGFRMSQICLKGQLPNSSVCTACQFNSDKPDEQYFISAQPHNLNQCKLSIQTCPNGLTRINGNTTSDAQCVFMNSTTTPLTTLPVISSPTDLNQGIPVWVIVIIVLILLFILGIVCYCGRDEICSILRNQRCTQRSDQPQNNSSGQPPQTLPISNGNNATPSSIEADATEMDALLVVETPKTSRVGSESRSPSSDITRPDDGDLLSPRVVDETSLSNPGTSQSPNQPQTGNSALIANDNRVETQSEPPILIPFIDEGNNSRVINVGPPDVRKSKNLENMNFVSPLDDKEVDDDPPDDENHSRDEPRDEIVNNSGNPEELTRSTSPRDHSHPNSQASTLTGATSNSIPGPSNRVSNGSEVDHSRVVIDEHDRPDTRKSRISEEPTSVSPINDDNDDDDHSHYDSHNDGNVHHQPHDRDVHQPRDVNDHQPHDRDVHQPRDVNVHQPHDRDVHQPRDVNVHQPHDRDVHQPRDVNVHQPHDRDVHQPRDVNVHQPHDRDVHQPRDVNVHQPHDRDVHQPRDVNVHQPHDRDVHQPRDVNVHNDSADDQCDAGTINSDPSSSTTPQNSSHSKLMWEICDRLCESVEYYIPMNPIYFLLVWFGYRRLNENFETLQRTREQRIQELFRLLVKDHEDGKLDDFPQRFKDFLLEKNLKHIFEYEIEPLYSEYHIEVE